jgi:hypothetical protein
MVRMNLKEKTGSRAVKKRDILLPHWIIRFFNILLFAIFILTALTLL